ncbi:MAG: peptide deformylase [Verrucomicrobia bacterium]|nr:peptide deformylase [Verrucomicrobiota bacterium]
MIRPIVLFADPVLRAVGARIALVTEEVQRLAADMLETMYSAEGVGLAAQQVGVALQLAVVDIRGVEDRPSKMWLNGVEVDPLALMPMVLLNPELVLGKEREAGKEGCLSFPKMTSDILRSIRVQCRAQKLDGTEYHFEAEGFLARALQHEVDHLNGVLFIDRMSSAAKASLAGKLKRLMRSGR